MTFVILPPLSDPSVSPKSGLPGPPDARYNFLAHSILSSLGENGGISLVVADSSVESGFLRETLEQIHGELCVFEVPCREAIASTGIIPSLPQFISSASSPSRRLASPGALRRGAETRHAPMLFICDGADGLEDDQLETMYTLSRGKHGPLGVVLLAKPEFLLRMQNSRLNHIRGALAACFWSQHSSYGGVCAADRQDQADGFMPLNPAQLPSPLIERLATHKEDAASRTHSFSGLQSQSAEAGTSRFVRRYRRHAITVAFSIAYLLIAGGTAYVLSWIPGHSQIAAASGEAPASLQPMGLPPSPPVRGAETASVRTDLAPPAAPLPNLVAKDAPATPAIAVPTNAAKKSAPSVPAVEEVQKHQEPDPATAPIETSLPAIAASAGAQQKPAAPAPAPETKLSDADRALFAQRGDELLAAGDIASARLFFERAANAGDARSALGMARTFDPRELAKAGVRGVKGDQAKADYWYQCALSLAGDKNYGIK